MNRAVLAVLVSLTLAGAVRAQDSADDARKSAALEEARQHLAKAKVHYDLGEFKEAADEYILVYRLRPIPAILFNVAQAYRQGGLYEKARQFYKSYLRESPEAKNRAAIEQSIREMDELLAKERKTREAPPKGVKVTAEASLPVPETPPAGKATPPATAAVAEAAKPQESAKSTETKAGNTAKPPESAKGMETASSAKTGTATVSKLARPPAGESPTQGRPPGGPTSSSDATVAIAPSRNAPAPTAARPASTFRSPSPVVREERNRTWTWVAAGASALALGGGAVFGVKTINGASTSDARTANVLYGAGAALAIASAALFAFEF